MVGVRVRLVLHDHHAQLTEAARQGQGLIRPGLSVLISSELRDIRLSGECGHHNKSQLLR